MIHEYCKGTKKSVMCTCGRYFLGETKADELREHISDHMEED